MSDRLYLLKDIEKRKTKPFIMANECLANEIFPIIKEKYPEAIMVKLEKVQYIALTRRGKTNLHKLLLMRKEKHERIIREIDICISEI